MGEPFATLVSFHVVCSPSSSFGDRGLAVLGPWAHEQVAGCEGTCLTRNADLGQRHRQAGFRHDEVAKVEMVLTIQPHYTEMGHSSPPSISCCGVFHSEARRMTD